jgi:hypothetical protein
LALTLAESPTQSVQQLIELLEAIRDQVDAIAHIERLKSLAIAGRDLESLAEITAREEANTDVLRALEVRRQQMVYQLAPGSSPNVTISDLAVGLRMPEGDALLDAADSLRSTVATTREIAHRNSGLLQWAAELAGTAAHWILGHTEISPAYTRSGTRQQDLQLSVRGWNA